MSIDVQDFSLADVYEGQNIAEHVPDVTSTGNPWNNPYGFIDAALRRLLYQYKNSTNLKEIIRKVTRLSYEEHAVLLSIPLNEKLATATRERLDGFGKILNVPRGALSDTDYRSALYLKIFMNFSEGTIENLIHIFGILMGANKVELKEYFPATISMQANVASLPDTVTSRIAVQQCKAAGVKIGYLTYTLDPPFVFYEDTDPLGLGFDDGTGTIGGYWAASF